MQTMETVTLSSKFQIVIPKKTREIAGLQSGEKLKIIAYDGRIELIPVKPMKSFRGMVKGINIQFERDGDRI
ncbi:MAG: AbrB/MazE/SpoVT family DNA-binding domain-containing protein [Synergistaceae bacterium]|jgi:AbrB family looped-hinge helix DNA binding protein|nr:AbrB/MazE/SpoVT family DNA-binding domain-containing protein [Synergistaceae bacterium]